jgi:hypothetical protein
MSEAMRQALAEDEAKDDLIDHLTAQVESYMHSFGIVSKENERLRQRLDETHRKYVAASREREIARSRLYKIRMGAAETLKAIDPNPNEAPPSVVLFGDHPGAANRGA